MADQRITQLTALAEADVAPNDVLPVVDLGANQTKKVTVKDLAEAGFFIADAGSLDIAKINQDSITKISTAALSDNSVTYAKIQNVSATDKVLGRSTAGAGVVEEITLTGAGRTLLAATDAATQRSTIGVGTIAVQAGNNVAITGGTITGITDLAIADGGTGASTAAAARINFGVVVGTDVQAYDAGVQSIADLTTTANQAIFTTASDTYATTTLTSFGRSLIDDTDAATARTTLGLGTLATQSGTITGTLSGTSTGNNTGDQTITLTGDVTGSGISSFAATIANNAITTSKIIAGAITPDQLATSAVTGVKLAADSTNVISGNIPSGNGAFTGQQWLNTNTGLAYAWTGATWQQIAAIQSITFTDSTPLAFAVTKPDNFSAVITTTLETQAATNVLIGPVSGPNAAPSFRAIAATDLPIATAGSNGVIKPGTGLAASATGVLNHSNAVTTGVYTKVTVDAQGHVSVGETLGTADIPNLDAAKITTGAFASAFLGIDSVTNTQLANYSTASLGATFPTASFIGQLHLNPLERSFYMWDGNVWVPIGISAGQILLAGTFNAATPGGASNTGLIQSLTPDGVAAGFVVGTVLPAPSLTNNKHYFVVSVGGTITTGNAPHVVLAPPDLILSIYNATNPQWVEIDVSAGAGAIAAGNVSFVPGGDVSSTDVQSAIAEVSIECRNATNITSGTLAVTRGGTGLVTYTKGDLLAASAATTLISRTVGTNGQILSANSAQASGLEWITPTTGSVSSVTGVTPIASTGGTTPAISIANATLSVVGAVQLSDSINTTSSVLAATPTAVKAAYDLAALALPAAGGIITGILEIGTTGSLSFEGATPDAFETILTVVDPTADNTITLPNTTGTVALTSQLNDGTF